MDDLTKTLNNAKSTAKTSVDTLDDVSARAEAAGRKLELLVASLHDLPDPTASQASDNPFFVRRSNGTEKHP